MEEGAAQGRTGIISYSLLIMVLTHILIHAPGNIRSTIFPDLKAEFSLTNQQIGLIVAIPTLCTLLFSIPTGLFSDRFGPRRLIALSIVMAAVGAFLGSVSASPWIYIAATTLLSLTSTLYHPPAQSYISSTTRPRDRARALGIFNAGGTFGVSLGPLSISVLMGILAFQWRQIYGLWALPILLGLVTLLFVKDSAEVVRRRASEEWDEGETAETLLNPNMIVFLLSSTIRTFGGSLTTGFLTIWLAESQGWTVAQMGVMYSASSMLGLVASPLGGEMASRLGEKRWLASTLFASYTCFVAAIALKGFWPFLVFYLGQRFFGILGMPGSIALTARLSPPRQRGMGFALSSVPGGVVGSLASIIAAYIADLYGLYPIFIVAAVIYYIGLGVLQFGVKVD